MKGYDKEFMDKTSKMDIIIGVITFVCFIAIFIAIIAIVKGDVDHINSTFDTAIEEYTAKGYVVCDVKVKSGRYNNIAVKEDEIASYKEKKSFMMSLHAISTDDIYIVSTDDITGIAIRAEEKGVENE